MGGDGVGKGSVGDRPGLSPTVHYCHAERSEASLWAGSRKILHFVQDDNWAGLGSARDVAMTTRGRPRPFITVMLNEVKHLSGQAAGRSFTSFRMTTGRGVGGRSEVAATIRSRPRLFTTVMLNEVKHLSGAGGRKILHFVQDDNWTGIGQARKVGRPHGVVPDRSPLSC